jgi:undecaprenyl-diphosphatase
LVLVFLLGLGWALGLLASDILADLLDGLVLRFVVESRTPWLTSTMAALTTLGTGALLLVVALLVGSAYWYWGRTTAPLVMLLSAWIGAELLFNVVKLLVDRTRPPVAMAVHHFGGLAFPSGHATTASAVWGMVAALLVLGAPSRRARIILRLAGALLVIVVGLTRVYLGAHWASDVFGGWLLGGLWLVAVLRLVGTRESLFGAAQQGEADV